MGEGYYLTIIVHLTGTKIIFFYLKVKNEIYLSERPY